MEGAPFFPLDIPGNKGNSRMAVDKLLRGLRALHEGSKQKKGFGYLIEERTINTRHAGAMSMPQRIYFAGEQDYLRFIGKTGETAAFLRNFERTQQQLPALLPWTENNPLKVVKHGEAWEDILKVCLYFVENPRPGLYIRELPVSVHTKFIESYRGVLKELLEFLLDPSDIDWEASSFELRFGLRYDEPLIRFRRLDAAAVPGFPSFATDISLPFSEFRQLETAVEQVFILENKQTFLSFPEIQRSMLVWGKGFAVELLKEVQWMEDKSIYFWGDLDMQGFQMLHQLRTYFHQTRSMLMDRDTFDTFSEFAVAVPPANIYQLVGLTPEEQAVFQWLKDQPANRLEQERITQAYLLEWLEREDLI